MLPNATGVTYVMLPNATGVTYVMLPNATGVTYVMLPNATGVTYVLLILVGFCLPLTFYTNNWEKTTHAHLHASWQKI